MGSALCQLRIRATADERYSQISVRTEFCFPVQWACFCFCNREPKSSRIILSLIFLPSNRAISEKLNTQLIEECAQILGWTQGPKHNHPVPLQMHFRISETSQGASRVTQVLCWTVNRWDSRGHLNGHQTHMHPSCPSQWQGHPMN